MSSLIEVLKLGQTYKNNIKDPFMNLALENIEKGDTIYLSVGFLQNLLSTFPHDDQQMGGFGSSQGGRQKYGMKNSQQAAEITIESLIGQILKKVDLYQHVIAQATAYMYKVKDIKSNEAQNISESGPRGQSSSPERNSQSQIDSAA